MEQKAPGSFEVPKWDQESQKKVRTALLGLAETLPDTNGMFGTKHQVDPVRRLIGSASAWGGNPQKDATYLSVTPDKNDGKTVYKLDVGKVAVDGFWSISVYDAKGYYEPNDQNAYTLNNITAKPAAVDTYTIQFGGCDSKAPNCLPVMSGWNYMVRFYQPHREILDGKWVFPKAQAMGDRVYLLLDEEGRAIRVDVGEPCLSQEVTLPRHCVPTLPIKGRVFDAAAAALHLPLDGGGRSEAAGDRWVSQ
ncbi:DUF1214 domain-containing protein [Rhizobium sp. 2YAF20]|uniref:DUF1214 domain-containing protein n=1 Tax=Rhizobium sp. 2YAF20 TaxID=3233027 RepID=UPI003F9E2434